MLNAYKIVECMMDGLAKQLTLRLMNEFGLQQKQIADALDVSQPSVNRWINHDAEPRGGTLEKLKELVAEYAGERLSAPREIKRIGVRGNVAAGTWYDDGEWDGSTHAEISAVDGPWANIPQMAYRVIGDSVDQLGIFDGGYVIAVNYFDARPGIINGDVVVVERRESSRVERTVKVCVKATGGWSLEPRSSNPKHKPIFVPSGRIDGIDREIIVAGLVIGYYRAFG